MWFAAVTFGQRGVDLFFVLSGYLIGTIALREFYDTGRIQLGRFWRRRWLRTLPAYYVVLGLYGIKQLVPFAAAGLSHPVSYVFFAQTYALGVLRDFAHSWSLAVEEHFYLALPLVLVACGWLGSKARPHVVTVLSVLALGLVLVRQVAVTMGFDVNVHLSHWRTAGLALGVIMAALQLRSERFRYWLTHHRRWLAAATLVLAGGAFALHSVRSRFWEESAVLACASAVAIGIAHHPFLELTGRLRAVRWMALVSYSFYLLHPLVLGTLRVFMFDPTLESPVDVVVFFVVGFALSSIVSQALYSFVERPFMRYRDRARSRIASTPRSGHHESLASNS